MKLQAIAIVALVSAASSNRDPDNGIAARSSSSELCPQGRTTAQRAVRPGRRCR